MVPEPMSHRLRFALAKPWMFIRGLLTNRDNPDFERLASIDDPERFVWAVLPHAARTFAPSIVALPYRHARAAAVAYLYARMLDTYEDLAADTEAKLTGLRGFAESLGNGAPALKEPPEADDRDRVHLLLLERCHLVDAVYATLPPTDQRRIREMVEAMSSGMQHFVAVFADQGGVLADPEQVEAYCHVVIGEPIAFMFRSLVGDGTAGRLQADAMDLSVLIQLANITRDIEDDLSRGIAYHPILAPQAGNDPVDTSVVAEARRELLLQGLGHLPTYGRLVDDLHLPWFSLARGSAVLMALKTDRHYRRMARATGLATWHGPDHIIWIWVQSSVSVVSPAWTRRVLDQLRVRSAVAAVA